jgi:class 3 adenylate cyclase
MTKLRTIVIMKTDIAESTPMMAGLSESELSTLVNRQRRFVSEVVGKNEGLIFREEGDAFWMSFPSVTAAVLAAIDLHQNLRAVQAGRGEKHRLAIRVVITVGDILYQTDDLYGHAMSLTARIEKVTPADEIYLSYAAWLILPKAEVPTAFVGEFALKGIPEPEKIYKVEQKHRTRSLVDQHIVFTDIRAWSAYAKSRTIAEVESLLLDCDDIMNEICDAHGGVIRSTQGDRYFLSFPELHQTLVAVDRLCRRWNSIIQRYGLGLSIGLHKGDVNILRSYVYGNDIHATVRLTELGPLLVPPNECSVVASQKIESEARGTSWEQYFHKLGRDKISDDSYRPLVEEYGAYQFILSPK